MIKSNRSNAQRDLAKAMRELRTLRAEVARAEAAAAQSDPQSMAKSKRFPSPSKRRSPDDDPIA